MIALLFIMPVLIDFGRYIYVQVELKQALRAGGQYALYDHTASANDGGIEQAVMNATGLSLAAGDITVDALSCECADGTATVCTDVGGYTGCGTDGVNVPSHFLTIRANATFSPLWPIVPWFQETMTINEGLTMRVL